MKRFATLTRSITSIYASNEHTDCQELLAPSLLKQPPTDIQHAALLNLDNSESVRTVGAFDLLKAMSPKFISDMRRDPTIRSSVLMSFGQFGNDRPLVLAAPFTTVDLLVPPKLTVTQSTPLCARLIASVELLTAGKRMLRQQFDVHQRKAWLIDWNDGEPTDPHLHDDARRAVQETAVANDIEVFLFGVGPKANMEFLHSIEQPERPAEPLSLEKDFASLFDWLKRSLSIVGASAPGQVLEIPSVKGSLIRTQG